MSKQSKMIIQANLEILVRAKKVEDLTLFTVLKMFRVLILGTQLDVSMVSLYKYKSNQIMIQENLLGKIAGMQYIQKKIKKDNLEFLQSVKIFLPNNLGVSLTIKTTEMNQKQQIYFFLRTFKKKEFIDILSKTRSLENEIKQLIDENFTNFLNLGNQYCSSFH